jgi:hypothetical protein
MKAPICFLAILVSPLPVVAAIAEIPPELKSVAEEPVRYTGNLQPDKAFFDGRLPHAVGVHHYQVMRANRTHPPEGGMTGWTYNHQPYLAFWNDRFYLQYLSGLYQEHTPPTRILYLTSRNGRDWSAPTVAFPPYLLPKISKGEIQIEAGTAAVMHQRMGWYVAPNGKLLILGFYGFAATPRNSPNAGNGIGRVVREIRRDGSHGPVYFIRYNRHAGFDESNTDHPFYRSSPDPEFVAACDALLADKLVTLQWWEEDRAEDGFYTINPGQVAGAAAFSATVTTSAGAGKAFNWFVRPDGIVVGIWKNQYSALSPDRGLTWTPIVRNRTLRTTGAKTWGERTSDGRFVIVHDHSATMNNRFPMVAFTGDDGHVFDSIVCLQGEVPPRRYQGIYKRPGPAYFRGITEGNGDPPDDSLWIVYSMNKEDIWISRTTVPILGGEANPVRQDFERVQSIMDLSRWNLHVPRWAPIRVVPDSEGAGRVLELRDEEPYDYARAERVFAPSANLTVRFRVQARAVARGCALDIEIQSRHGARPMRLRMDDAWLGFDSRQQRLNPSPILMRKWYSVELRLDCVRQVYALLLDGEIVNEAIPFTEEVEALERVVFRTGPYRGYVPPAVVDDGSHKPSGLDTEDLPGSGERVTPSVFWIDDLDTGSL